MRVQTPSAVPKLVLLYPNWPSEGEPFSFGCLESYIRALGVCDLAIVVSEVKFVQILL